MATKTKRILMYGGAASKSDNSAFYYASLNVQKDYKNDMEIQSILLKNGAIQIQDLLAKERDSTIQSLDIFCHGNSNGVYFVENASLEQNVERGSVVSMSLYKDDLSEIHDIMRYGVNPFKQLEINDLNLAAFTYSCKIEIHGCNTAFEDDNFCENLSLELYKLGKKDSVVIGHAEKANPNINGTKNIKEQDYRHGLRSIYNNGKLLKQINTTGRIMPSIIKSALATRSE